MSPLRRAPACFVPAIRNPIFRYRCPRSLLPRPAELSENFGLPQALRKIISSPRQRAVHLRIHLLTPYAQVVVNSSQHSTGYSAQQALADYYRRGDTLLLQVRIEFTQTCTCDDTVRTANDVAGSTKPATLSGRFLTGRPLCTFTKRSLSRTSRCSLRSHLRLSIPCRSRPNPSRCHRVA
jgi:hypothetical protein